MISPGTKSMTEGALVGRRLLDHPFYRRWERGEVALSELADYAAQYRHFEGFLPEFLGELAAALPPGPSRDLVVLNLSDEMGDPVPHVELFERFASAVGAQQAEPSPAMSGLIELYRDLLGVDPVAALAAFLAYEHQAAEVAATKAEGLRSHYRVPQDAVSFWEHHAKADVVHAEWAMEALASAGNEPATLERSLRAAADAWWAFLDERELARPAA